MPSKLKVSTEWVREAPADPVLVGAQAHFVASSARYPGFFGGRGAGKTVAAVMKLIQYVQAHPGCRGVLTFPTLGDVRKVFLPVMFDFFGHLHKSVWEYYEAAKELHFPAQGVTVFVRPASEPDSCRGPTIAFAAMDEIGTEDQWEAFRILQGAIRQPGYPNQLWVTSTPRVDFPWIKSLWYDRIHPLTGNPVNEDNYPTFFRETKDNVFLPEWQRTELYEEWGDSRWALQELRGQFIEVGSVAFPELNEERHRRYPPPDTEFRRHIAGIDFGMASPTSIILWGEDRSHKLWALQEFYKAGADDYDWLQWCTEHGINSLICDPSASDERLRYFRNTYGISVRRSRARSFQDRYRNWLGKLAGHGGEPGIYITPACPNLWTEMTNLAFKMEADRSTKMDKWKTGSADHAYDAASYALDEFTTPPGRPRPNFTLGAMVRR